MEESLALQVVRSFIAKINAHCVASMCELMTDDHRCVDVFGVTGQGRAALRQAWQTYFSRVPDYRIVCQQVISEDQTIAIFGTVSGTDRHDGVRQGGQPWEVPAAWNVVVRGTRVAVWQVYYAAPLDRRPTDAAHGASDV
ncbi:MAG TPA: nuclear transport factor 2 family protein [Herpetosiphonaceae bacterium]